MSADEKVSFLPENHKMIEGELTFGGEKLRMSVIVPDFDDFRSDDIEAYAKGQIGRGMAEQILHRLEITYRTVRPVDLEGEGS